jgi:hypothetical protein
MTPVFGLLTAALLLIYSGIKNRNPFEVIAGIGSEVVNPAAVDTEVNIPSGDASGLAALSATPSAQASIDQQSGGNQLESSGDLRGTVKIDGKDVPKWIAKWVLLARKKGLWHGSITSGVRTPEYSEQLCYDMCGQPSCPGTCAGRSSNHNCTGGCRYPSGAIDVTDEAAFAAAMKKLKAPLKNDLPSDRVHFSASGH